MIWDSLWERNWEVTNSRFFERPLRKWEICRKVSEDDLLRAEKRENKG